MVLETMECVDEHINLGFCLPILMPRYNKMAIAGALLLAVGSYYGG